MAEPANKPARRYWVHAESESVFATDDGLDVKAKDTLVEEIDEAEYLKLKAEQEAQAAPQPAAEPERQRRKFSFEEMLAAVYKRAEDIEGTEQVAIAMGLRAKPLPERIDEADCFRALWAFLLKIDTKRETVANLLRAEKPKRRAFNGRR